MKIRGDAIIGGIWQEDDWEDLVNKYKGYALPDFAELAARATVLRNATWVGNSSRKTITIKQPQSVGSTEPKPELLQFGQMVQFASDGDKDMTCFLSGTKYTLNGVLPSGSVLLPGIDSNNPTVDMLVLLSTPEGRHVLLFIENKRKNELWANEVQRKIDNLRMFYRDKLFVKHEGASTDPPEEAKKLGLPLVLERNVVFAVLTASGTEVKPLDGIDVGNLEAQVVHMEAEYFFGPSFSLLPVIGRFQLERRESSEQL